MLMPFNGINTHSIVILDNCSIHHLEIIEQTITTVGALIRLLPPYSPDLNPIKFVFSKVKSFWKAKDVGLQFTFSSRTKVIIAFKSITQQDAFGCIKCRIHVIVCV